MHDERTIGDLMERFLANLRAPSSVIAETWKFAKFAMVGLCTVGCYFAIWSVAALVLRSTALIAALAYVGSAVFNYIFQRRITFRSDLAVVVSFPRYVVMHLLAMAVNAALAFLLIDVYEANFFASLLLIVALIAFFTFTISRVWVYAAR